MELEPLYQYQPHYGQSQHNCRDTAEKCPSSTFVIASFIHNILANDDDGGEKVESSAALPFEAGVQLSFSALIAG